MTIKKRLVYKAFNAQKHGEVVITSELLEPGTSLKEAHYHSLDSGYQPFWQPAIVEVIDTETIRIQTLPKAPFESSQNFLLRQTEINDSADEVTGGRMYPDSTDLMRKVTLISQMTIREKLLTILNRISPQNGYFRREVIWEPTMTNMSRR